MRILSKLIAIFLLSILFISCAKEKEDSDLVTSSDDNALTGSTSKVNTSSAKLAALMTTSSKILEAKRIVQNLAPAWWDTTTAIPDPVSGSGNLTPKDWMGVQLNENAVRTSNGSAINVFGRLKGELGVFCTIGMVLGSDKFDANGYPTNGDHTAVITAALASSIKTKCGLDTGGQAVNVPITVSDAGGSIYDKKLVITTPPDNNIQTIYMKVTSTEVKIASSEGYTNSSIEYFSRTIVSIANDVLKVEYISASDDEANVAGGGAAAVAYFHRLYYNDADNIGIVGSFIYGNGSTDNAYLLSGDPDAASPAFSLTFYDSSVDSGTPHTVCVNGSTGVITDTANHCGGSNNANFLFPSNTAAGLRNTWGGNDGASGAFYDGANYLSISNTSDFTFTDETDFNTQVFSKN